MQSPVAAKHAFPGPGKALRGAMGVQRHHDWSIERVGFSLGYHDGSSLSRQLHQVFGHRPSFIRPRLGWRWLVDDWLREMGWREGVGEGQEAG